MNIGLLERYQRTTSIDQILGNTIGELTNNNPFYCSRILVRESFPNVVNKEQAIEILSSIGSLRHVGDTLKDLTVALAAGQTGKKIEDVAVESIGVSHRVVDEDYWPVESTILVSIAVPPIGSETYFHSPWSVHDFSQPSFRKKLAVTYRLDESGVRCTKIKSPPLLTSQGEILTVLGVTRWQEITPRYASTNGEFVFITKDGCRAVTESGTVYQI